MKLAEKPLEDRVIALEISISEIKKKLQKKTIREELTLKQKFSIHDRAQHLLAEFEEMPFFKEPGGSQQQSPRASSEQIHRIIRDFVKLVDNALGITP